MTQTTWLISAHSKQATSVCCAVLEPISRNNLELLLSTLTFGEEILLRRDTLWSHSTKNNPDVTLSFHWHAHRVSFRLAKQWHTCVLTVCESNGKSKYVFWLGQHNITKTPKSQYGLVWLSKSQICSTQSLHYAHNMHLGMQCVPTILPDL